MPERKVRIFGMDFPTKMLLVVDQVRGIEVSTTEDFIKRSVRFRMFLDEQRQTVQQAGTTPVIRIGEEELNDEAAPLLYTSAETKRKIHFSIPLFEQLQTVARTNLGQYVRESVALSIRTAQLARKYSNGRLTFVPLEINGRYFDVEF